MAMAEMSFYKPSSEEQLAKIGTSEHLTTEELIEFYFLHTGFDEYFLHENRRIINHTFGCKECKKKSSILESISTTGKYYARIINAAKDMEASPNWKAQLLTYIDQEINDFDVMVNKNIPQEKLAAILAN